ncbi:MAG: hypothetical protein ACK5NY_10760 [Burkholderiaceae bacterium]
MNKNISRAETYAAPHIPERRPDSMAEVPQTRLDSPIPPPPAKGSQLLACNDPVNGFVQRLDKNFCSWSRIDDLNQAPETVAAYLRARDLPLDVHVWPAIGHLGWTAAGLRLQDEPQSVTVGPVLFALIESGLIAPCDQTFRPAVHIAVLHADQIIAHTQQVLGRVEELLGKAPPQLLVLTGPVASCKDPVKPELPFAMVDKVCAAHCHVVIVGATSRAAAS